MQIFWPNNDCEKSAQALDDQRLRKQIIELGQILSTAIWLEDCAIGETLTAMKCIYLPTHENHPVMRNCKWYYCEAFDFLKGCIDEYFYRFNKIHKTFDMLPDFEIRAHSFFKYGMRPFINCTTNHKHVISTTEAYRQCLIEKWQYGNPKWTNRKRPDWAKTEE